MPSIPMEPLPGRAGGEPGGGAPSGLAFGAENGSAGGTPG